MADPKKDIAISLVTQDIKTLITTAKNSAVSYVNSTLTMLYWQIGKCLVSAGLRDNTAKYGDKAIENISISLVNEYGQGFNYSSLHRMMRFAELISDQKIVATLSQDLSWSHFVILITLKESIARDFYIEMCKLEKWSVRQLRKSIDSMLFERIALSKKPETMIREELDQLFSEVL